MIALLVLGAALSLIGGIWLLILAFQESLLWGLGCLLFGPVSLIFALVHWNEAKRPFLISLAGGLLTVIAVMGNHPQHA